MRRLLLGIVPLLVLAAPLGAQAPHLTPLPQTRLVAGQVYAADGGEVAGVRVVVTGEVYADSVAADSAGRFSLEVPAFPVGPLRVRVRSDSLPGRYHPALLRVPAGRSGEGLVAVLVPRRVTIPGGRYAGLSVPIDLREATRRVCESCGAFYRTVEGDSLPGRRPGIPAWPPAAFPLRVAIDPEVGPRLTPRDSIAFWRAAGEVEAAFGLDLFEAAPIEMVLEPPDGDPRGQVLVNVDPTLRTDGWGTSAGTAGDLLASAVMLRRVSDFTSPRATGLVGHELMHALGFGHTCSWRSVVSAEQCPGQRSDVVTPEDVAYALLLWRIRALERRFGIDYTVTAARAAGEDAS